MQSNEFIKQRNFFGINKNKIHFLKAEAQLKLALAWNRINMAKKYVLRESMWEVLNKY